jgi:hypothetical protein
MFAQKWEKIAENGAHYFDLKKKVTKINWLFCIACLG